MFIIGHGWAFLAATVVGLGWVAPSSKERRQKGMERKASYGSASYLTKEMNTFLAFHFASYLKKRSIKYKNHVYSLNLITKLS